MHIAVVGAVFCNLAEYIVMVTVFNVRRPIFFGDVHAVEVCLFVCHREIKHWMKGDLSTILAEHIGLL